MTTGHPVHSRIADVVAQGPGIDRRGSGYLVADGWVLTARHVVAGAERIGVWLGVPAVLEDRLAIGADPARALLDEHSDLALLPLDARVREAVEPALFGRLDRESAAVIPVVAAGFPRFKLRPSPAKKDVLVRDLEETRGSIAPRANARTGTYELADLSLVPGEDPEPDRHSAWEGMSGAAVWADDRLVAVVGQHHPGEGRGALTLRPVEILLAGSPDRAAAWREVLPSGLPRRPGELWPVRRSTPGEADLNLARRVASALTPETLEGRDDAKAHLDDLLTSNEQWCWVVGDAFAGKTALLAWLVTHPPPDVAVVSCFFRETDPSTTTAEYSLTRLTGQLAAMADRLDYRPASFVPELRAQFAELLDLAARACRERGHRLALVLDGLDEYDPLDVPLRDWIPDIGNLPTGTTLLASSRSGVELDLPIHHPLRSHPMALDPAPAAQLRRAEAMHTLTRALSDPGRLDYAVLGFLSLADGPLAPNELRLLLMEMSIVAFGAQVTTSLTGRLRRVVTAVSETHGRTAFTFAHPALRDAALELLADDRADFATVLRGWSERFRDAGWPEDTPAYVLTRHPRALAASGRYDELAALVADDRWRRRLEVFDPSHATYLSNVQIAWRAAEEHSATEVSAGGLAGGLDVEIRACLDVASVSSLSSRMTPRMLTVLVQAGIWSPEAAFEVARQPPTAFARSKLLVGLANVPIVSDGLRERVVGAAMTATAAVDDEMRSAWQWGELAPLLPDSLLDEAMRVVQGLPRRLHDDRRPRSLAEAALLARAVAVGRGEYALESIAALSDDDDRARALAEVAGALPADLFEAALGLVRALELDTLLADPLAGLAVAALGRNADDRELAREAFETAMALPSPGERSWVLRRLAPALPESWVAEALDHARTTLFAGDRWTLLNALIHRLGILGRWEGALEVAREMHEAPVWLVRGLVTAASYAPDSIAVDLAEELVDAALSLDPISRPFELVRVAPYLTERLLRRALEPFAGADDHSVAARRALWPRLAQLGHASEAYEDALATQSSGRILDRYPGVDAWADLVPYLPESMKANACAKALSLIWRVDDVNERTWVEVAATCELGDQPTEILLERVAKTDDHVRARLLRVLAPYLPDDLLEEAVQLALALPAVERFGGHAIGSSRADTLTALAPRLGGELRKVALLAARDAAVGIDDPKVRDMMALRIAAAFGAPEAVTEEARQAVERQVREAGPWPWRDEVVHELREVLPAELVDQLSAERRTSDGLTVERVNAWLAQDSSGRGPELSTLCRAVGEVERIQDVDLRAALVDKLAAHAASLLTWSDGDEPDARAEARSRADILSLLGPKLPEAQMPGALRIALDLVIGQWASPSRDVLAPLAEALTALPRGQLHPLWTESLHVIATLHRSQALRHLVSLLPVLLALGGEEAARSLLHSVEEVGKQWP